MYQHLLVPLDGSPLAEAVLAPARMLAQAMQARVTLFHVLERSAPKEVHGQPHLTEAPAAEAYLKRLVDGLRQEGIPADCHVHDVAEPDVAASIHSHAAEFGCDLIVLATHGQSGLREHVFGSIAQQVLGFGKTPILVFHPEEAAVTGFRRILVPLDGATDHEAALPLAADFAATFGATVHLMTAVPRRTDLGGAGRAGSLFLPRTTSAWLDIQEQESARYLQGLAANLRASDIDARCRVDRGDPTETILQALADSHADLLVMATHARRGWAAFWNGSVGPGVLAGCRKPVLLARA